MAKYVFDEANTTVTGYVGLKNVNPLTSQLE